MSPVSRRTFPEKSAGIALLAGFTKQKTVSVDAPVIAESPIHVECRIFNTIDVPPERVMFPAEGTAMTVHEGVCDQNGRLQVNRVPFFGMTAGSGEFYTMGECAGHIGQSAGRNDITY